MVEQNSSVVNVIYLQSADGDESDLMVNAVTSGSAEDDEYTIEVKATDGAIKVMTEINSSNLHSSKSASASNLDYDFKRLIYEIFNNQLPERLSRSVELIGRQDSNENVVLQVNLLIGGSIKNELISFRTKSLVKNDDDDEEEDDSFDLFEWTRLLKNDRDVFQAKYNQLSLKQDKAQEDLKKALNTNEELIAQMKEKQDLQIKIFTQIINDFQSYNLKILSGEITDEDDAFNLDKIRSLVNEVSEEQAGAAKKRKLAKNEKTPKMGRSRTRTETLIEGEDKDEDEDNDTEMEDELPLPIKASTEPSIHFKFRNQNVKGTDDTGIKEEDITNVSIPDTQEDRPKSDDKDAEGGADTDTDNDNEFNAGKETGSTEEGETDVDTEDEETANEETEDEEGEEEEEEEESDA